MQQSRRRFLEIGAMAAVAGTTWPRLSSAADISVPIALQCKLLDKVVRYDRNMAARAGTSLRTVVVHVEASASTSAAATLTATLPRMGEIGGLPVALTSHPYTHASALAELCKAQGVALLYLTPGLDSELSNIAQALNGMSILSVSAVPEHVQKGVVLGFDLVEGKPKILVNLVLAKNQQVAFQAGLLQLAQVIRG